MTWENRTEVAQSWSESWQATHFMRTFLSPVAFWTAQGAIRLRSIYWLKENEIKVFWKKPEVEFALNEALFFQTASWKHCCNSESGFRFKVGSKRWFRNRLWQSRKKRGMHIPSRKHATGARSWINSRWKSRPTISMTEVTERMCLTSNLAISGNAMSVSSEN